MQSIVSQLSLVSFRQLQMTTAFCLRGMDDRHVDAGFFTPHP